MRFEKLAQSLRLPALAMFSVFLFACGEGDGPDEITDPRFANCPGPDCVLNPVPPGPPPATANLLVNGSFEDGTFLPWINAGVITNDTDRGAPITFNNYHFTINVAVAGNLFEPSIQQLIPLTDGDTYRLNFRARASVARTIVAGIGLAGAPFTADTRVPELTTEWQGFSYDLVAPACSTVVPDGCRVLFDLGGQLGTIDIDDVSVTPIGDTSDERVTDYSFSTGAFGAPWTANNTNAGPVASVVEEAGNDDVYFVNVASAGPPFNVNLSQIFTITPGVTYKLTFRARTDAPDARTMLAGLGLNEPPFTADTATVLLTDDGDWRSYTYTITPTFGNSNSRVLFDMGAAVGDVYIDDVFVSVVP